VSILAVLDSNDVQENSKTKYLNELTLDDLFLETNYKNNIRNIILCKDSEFKILKRWGRPPKDSRVFDISYLHKVIKSL
jgi:hypothetical protein